MRRLRGAFQRMTSFEALWRASRRARRGKRRVQGAALFEHGLEENLLCLQDELRSGAFRFSGYRTFVVREPVQREIRAAPYRDRVVHHALCAELEPAIEGHLIHDTYANFTFAKMAMVEDLKRNGEALANSPLIAAVAGHGESRRALAEAVAEVEAGELDERPPADDFLVLDADSTQQRAIVLVGAGQNGVVQGPPGTGKSQTISNLIAQTVADGRRVLFVAEKRAALDAVIKRLSHPDVGLGHLVLDLHGAAVSRKEVMARLSTALDQIRHATPVARADIVHREFEARRRQLNEHSLPVNKPRPPTDLSVNRLIGRLLRLPAAACSALRLRGETLAALTAERADQVRQWLLDGARHPALLLGTEPSPWNNADIRDGRGRVQGRRRQG